ncbi:hypothetical protein VN97_g7184 [Penicillium thymicola]|uniref:Uncharacterized protein n=1 Tax=Penicillium thymicola TaxID=293382 RepID=A0AAI9TF25_PENTH|nr:hypothetical protein VN97_g7184 [Penicillium thymicola]
MKLPEERSIIARFLGDGLTIVEGEEHQRQRKRLTPVYSLRNIKDLYPIFWSTAVKLTQCISKNMEQTNKKSGVYEINFWANQATIDLIAMAGLGKEFNCLDGAENELFTAYQEIFTWAPEKEVYMALNRILSPKIIEAIPWGINERINVTTAILRRVCRELVDEKLDAYTKQETDKNDILSLMISQGSWTAERLVEQLLTFIAAGTVGPLLAGEAQQDPASISGLLENLPYLNAVCNEVIRFYPPVPFIRRYSIIPTTILGHHVPAGTRVILCPWATNRDPALWGPEAAAFKPERWIDPVTGRSNKEGGMSSSFANLTFSHGPRSCIGQNFAKAELRTLVAVFVSKFKFQMAVPGENIVPVGIVSPDHLFIQMTHQIRSPAGKAIRYLIHRSPILRGPSFTL